MKKKQPVLLGHPGKMPKSQLKTLLLLVLLVLALPLLALAAKAAVDLSSRAYIPPSALCREALVKHNFERPCKTVEPKGTSRQTQKTISRFKSYNIINFTCIDGFTQRHEVKTCLSEDKLLSYAYTVCNQHSILKDINFSEGCIVKTPILYQRTARKDAQKQQALKGYKNTKFTCADGFVTDYTSACQTEEKLRLYAQKICASHSICPTKPTPTKTPTPTVSITPTASVTPTATPSGNVAPSVVTVSLPPAIAGETYNASVEAKDPNSTDQLNMTFSGLPDGLLQGPCAIPAAGGMITCYIYGTPRTVGKFPLEVSVWDNKGGTTTKSILITVSGPTPQP